MNWSLNTVLLPAEGKGTVEALLDHARGSANLPDVPELHDQLTAAGAAIDELIRSGAVGEGPYFADLSGLASPGHKPRAGFNEVLTITLRLAPTVPLHAR